MAQNTRPNFHPHRHYKCETSLGVARFAAKACNLILFYLFAHRCDDWEKSSLFLHNAKPPVSESKILGSTVCAMLCRQRRRCGKSIDALVLLCIAS